MCGASRTDSKGLETRKLPIDPRREGIVVESRYGCVGEAELCTMPTGQSKEGSNVSKNAVRSTKTERKICGYSPASRRKALAFLTLRQSSPR